jgi:hypothetical protein
VAELIGPELGWAPARMEAEAEAYAAATRQRLLRAGLDPFHVGPAPDLDRTDGPAAAVAPASDSS